MIRVGTAGLSSLLSLALALLYSAHVHFASPFVLTRSATLEGVLVLTAVTSLVQIRTIHSVRTSVPLAGLAGYLLVWSGFAALSIGVALFMAGIATLAAAFAGQSLSVRQATRLSSVLAAGIGVGALAYLLPA